MRGKWIVISLVFFACQQDFFPPGLYDYQVERLLSNDEAKVWLERVNSNNCSDSLRLYIEFLPHNTGDSIAIFQLTPQPGCVGFDTALIGNANASRIDDGLLFTDSLNFESGLYWIVESITSNSLILRQDASEIAFYTSN